MSIAFPIMVVVGHFTPPIITGIICFIFIVLKRYTPWIAFQFAIFQSALSLIAVPFAFNEFPLWFFIIYMIYLILYLYDFIAKILRW